MAISSVTSSASAYTTALQQSPDSQRAQQTQRAEQQEPKAQEQVEKKEETQQPVINAQGQATGTLVNTTA